MLNHIVLMGRLTRDPELRHTGSGVAVVSFTLAVDRDFKNQNGEKECDFVDITAWRSTAEFVSRFFTKGRMAVVSGRLQSRKYTDKSGNNRTAWEVQADNVYFGDSKRDGASGGSYSEYGSFAPPAAANNSYAAPQGGYSAPQGGYAAPAAPTNDFSMLDSDDSQLPF